MSGVLDTGNPPGKFPSTHWSTIFQAGQPEEEAGLEALGRLLEQYRDPLLLHLARRFGAAEEEAEDWFQSFVERKVLRRRILNHARAERGRFRTFLLNALDHFVADELRQASRLRRKPTGGFVRLDPLAEPAGSSPAQGAPDPFDVAWAKAVLKQAGDRLQEYYRSKERMDLWGVFWEGLVRPTLDETKPPSMTELARQFGFKSATQASNGLTTAKRQFKKTLESVVAEYAEDSGAVREELRDLQAMLVGAD